MTNTTVLVHGAGTAGLALAYWLHQHGFTPTVVERASALRDGGYKVDIRGAAVDVTDRMGLRAEVRAVGTDMQEATFVNGTGRSLATMDADLFGGRTAGDVEIMRGDLNRLLYDRTRDHVEYVFHDSMTAMTDRVDGMRVGFERARPRTFDLVIGADGLHSTTRALTFGDETRFLHDLGYYVAVFSVPNHLGLDRRELTYPLPGRTALLYGTRRDAAATAMLLFASPPLRYDRRDVARQQELVAEAFDGVGWEVPRLLAAMSDADDFHFDSLSQVHAKTWSDNRVALVGDAAYGASLAAGQGTSMALVGAYVLAGELAAAGGHHDVGFHRYEARMRGFVERNQALAHSNIRGMVMRSAALIRVQLLMLRLLPYLPGRDRIAGRVADTIHAAATAIELPGYGLEPAAT
jgi:2-polyprenyl-6-methoxyphenol hydroxylase-like FAD-dependent oxidoreductase